VKSPVADAVRELLGDQPPRPGQMEAIEAALATDTVAVLATGLGKTLVSHVVGRLLHGTTLVVSPTIALQADQLAALRERDPDAVALTLNSALGVKARRAMLQDLSRGGVAFLLLTPEQLMKGGPGRPGRRRRRPGGRRRGALCLLLGCCRRWRR
jgi:ATP-dependent DNA helicase RecQ